ncbi:MAG: hemerythrin family protein [bacterium]|nr:hemerythrin family protein [bacterium]
MTILNWEEKYAIGHPIIDQQHRNMLTIGNQLLLSLQTNRSKQETLQVLEALIAESELHFQTEEELMYRLGFGSYVNHKIDHDALKAQIKILMRECENDRVKAKNHLISIVRNWLLEHVMSYDKGLGRFLADRKTT